MKAGFYGPPGIVSKRLLFRVPPWPQPQTVSATVPGDDRGVERLTYAPRQANRVGGGLENPCRVRMTD
jgi:hypothetical protein